MVEALFTPCDPVGCRDGCLLRVRAAERSGEALLELLDVCMQSTPELYDYPNLALQEEQLRKSADAARRRREAVEACATPDERIALNAQKAERQKELRKQQVRLSMLALAAAPVARWPNFTGRLTFPPTQSATHPSQHLQCPAAQAICALATLANHAPCRALLTRLRSRSNWTPSGRQPNAGAQWSSEPGVQVSPLEQCL